MPSDGWSIFIDPNSMLDVRVGLLFLPPSFRPVFDSSVLFSHSTSLIFVLFFSSPPRPALKYAALTFLYDLAPQCLRNGLFRRPFRHEALASYPHLAAEPSKGASDFEAEGNWP